LSLEQAVGAALRAWALGDRLQRQTGDEAKEGEQAATRPAQDDPASLYAHLRTTVAEKTVECAVLDRNQPGSSKYRALTADEIGQLLPGEMDLSHS
jgi:proteasome alpha subunit